jgi:hypothetical protein
VSCRGTSRPSSRRTTALRHLILAQHLSGPWHTSSAVAEGVGFSGPDEARGSLQPVSAVCVGRPRFQRPRTTLEPLWLEQPKLSTRDRTQRRSRVCWRAPQARPWGARALLRAGRRGDEASGEDSMLTPETRGRQRRLFSGDSWRCLATTFERWQHRRRRCDTDRCGETARITQETE